MLSLENVKIKINNEIILHDISFKLNTGEIMGIVGLNGAGKTTLARAISGACPVSDGRIIYNDVELTNLGLQKTQAHGISYLSRKVNLCEGLSIAENFFLGIIPKKSLLKIAWEEMYRAADEALHFIGCYVDSHTTVSELSDDQKRSVELAKAVFRKSSLIILDESISCKTFQSDIPFNNLLLKLKENKISVILISHHTQEILNYCDSIIIVARETISDKYAKNAIDFNNLFKILGKMQHETVYPKINVKLGDNIFTAHNIRLQENTADISISLRNHEILGIYGTSSSGKDHLARILAGLKKCPAGKFEIFGTPVVINKPMDAIHAGIGFLSQDSTDLDIFPNLTIPQNITISNLKDIYTSPLPFQSESLAAEDMKELLYININDFEQPIEHLSGGNQQKVRLARRLFSHSRILIMENPTSGIDIIGKCDIYNYICNYVLANCAIILVSEELDELMGLCDRIIVMKEYGIIKCLNRSEFSEQRFEQVLRED